MYRQYEDPRELTKQLDEKKAHYEELAERVDNGELDFDVLVDAHEDIAELEDRVNFAWQDEEFEENYRIENPYTANPLDDEDFMAEDDEDYFFDIPNDAF